MKVEAMKRTVEYRLPEQSIFSLGKYAEIYLAYLKTHRRETYTTLLTECQLNAELHRFEKEAKEQVQILTEQIVKSRGITEKLKEENPLVWTQQMNTARHDAEEVAFSFFE